jgi:hypothetical protein
MNEVIKTIKPKTIGELSKMSCLEIHEFVSDYLYEEYGITDTPLQHLIAILATEIKTYAICLKRVREDGILLLYNGGKTQGANPYLSILNRSSKNIMRIIRKLGLISERSRLGESLQKLNKTDVKLGYKKIKL